MIKTKLLLPAALILATSLTSVPVAASEANSGSSMSTEASSELEEKLAEKLDNSEITQEKYDEIMAAIESGELCGVGRFSRARKNRGVIWGKYCKSEELTEEQIAEKKAEMAEKMAEMAEKKDEILSEKLAAGEITQEQYDEIMAAIESGDFSNLKEYFGGMKGNCEKPEGLTEEQIAEKKAEMEEKIAEKKAAMESGDYSSMNGNHGGMNGNRGGMNGNHGSMNGNRGGNAGRWSK